MYQLLEFDPKKRISAEDALNHPYFKEMPKMKVWVGDGDVMGSVLKKCRYLTRFKTGEGCEMFFGCGLLCLRNSQLLY